MTVMKMSEAAIEWVPSWWSDPAEGVEPGSVRVARKGRSWWRGAPFWLDVGSPSFPDRDLTDVERVLQMFLDFHAMVVRDGIDPQVLHAEMLKVEEYRQQIARDIPGAAPTEGV
jgi:hypothetical protein